ncbi:MAG TPA: hypothetical protein VFF79_14285 [Conexibacter sp.]|jgi:hypothetical protein|nr:hypothetical protein [Conexibacter sp.]
MIACRATRFERGAAACDKVSNQLTKPQALWSGGNALPPAGGGRGEPTGEAIANALLCAGRMTGRDGITAHGLDGETALAALRDVGWKRPS